MKRLQRISAISAKYSGSREIRSSEVLLYNHIKLGPWFHPLTMRLSISMSFIDFLPIVLILLILGAHKATLSALTTSWGPHNDPQRC